jgi:hypothetical protein
MKSLVMHDPISAVDLADAAAPGFCPISPRWQIEGAVDPVRL